MSQATYGERPRAVAQRLRSGLRAVGQALPPPRDDGFRQVVGGTRLLLTGRRRSAALAAGTAPGSPPEHQPPAGFELPKPPRVDVTSWSVPPTTGLSGRSSTYDTGARPPRFDVELLEQLNAEYASKPLVTRAPSYKAETLAESARGRVLWVHRTVDLRGMRVLEVGCGSGYETWYAAHGLGADAHGVDVVEWDSWKDLRGERTTFHATDLALDNPFLAESFDRLMSFTVWEHVRHPYELLEQAYRLLAPGGLAWIRANLHAGPKASHRYRQIHFPWPHLLFSDDVIADWDRLHGRETTGAAWVNRLSWAHYEQYFDQIGFDVVRRVFTRTPLDEEFFARFEDVLGRYPRWDLETDYFLVVLRKPLPGEGRAHTARK